jgi:hypothetical protein
MGKLQNFIASAFRIEQQMNQQVIIRDVMTHELSVFRNQLWYRGDATELHQFYTQFDDQAGNTKFWRGVGSTGINFRKIHTGLPALIVDRLVDIVIDDMNEIEFPESTPDKERYETLTKEYDFKALLKEAVGKALYEGDGAFKISIDPDISDYPLVEYYGADRVDYVYRRGRLDAIIFKTERTKNDKRFLLKETYSRNGISYRLYNAQGTEVTVSEIEDFGDLLPAEYSNDLIWAVPLMFDRSVKFPGRGKSIFDTKSDAFDAFDEVFSQWMDALRDNRTKTYIPSSLLPQYTGADGKSRELPPNSFDNRYVKTDSQGAIEGKADQISVEQGTIQADALNQTYVTALDLCLQGIISPSTLGIDVKKLDNAESQREKEKATLYTRNRIISTLQIVVPKLIQTIISVEATINKRAISEVKATITFGEYANPSFEAKVETIGKAKGSGIMSLDRCVKELYGDTLDEKEIDEEVRKIKEESGMAEASGVSLIDTQPQGNASMTTLNGAQIQSVLKITEQLKAGTLSRASAIALVVSTLGMTQENAEAILSEQVPEGDPIES